MNAIDGQRTYAPRPQTFLPAVQDIVVSEAETTSREIDVAVRDLAEAGGAIAHAILEKRRADLDASVELLRLVIEKVGKVRRHRWLHQPSERSRTALVPTASRGGAGRNDLGNASTVRGFPRTEAEEWGHGRKVWKQKSIARVADP
jgi:hypothetical protein